MRKAGNCLLPANFTCLRAQHVKFAQLCFLTLIFQRFAFHSWIWPSDANFLTYACSIARRMLHCCDFEAAGNQLRVEGSKLQTILRPAEPNSINWDRNETRRNQGLCTKGCAVNKLPYFLLEECWRDGRLGSASKVSSDILSKAWRILKTHCRGALVSLYSHREATCIFLRNHQKKIFMSTSKLEPSV